MAGSRSGRASQPSTPADWVWIQRSFAIDGMMPDGRLQTSTPSVRASSSASGRSFAGTLANSILRVRPASAAAFK